MEKEDWTWLGVRLATADEVEQVGRDPGLRDTGGVAWWTSEVDWADDDFIDVPEAFVAARIALGWVDYGVAVVVDPHGPGGGWPVVHLFAPFDKLMSFLASHHDDDRIATLSRDEFEADWREIEAPGGADGIKYPRDADRHSHGDQDHSHPDADHPHAGWSRMGQAESAAERQWVNDNERSEQ